jgi:hypothetical protein
MTIPQLILLLVQLLPTLLDDWNKIVAVLDTSSAAVRNAQAGDGKISAEDWAALDAHVEGDLARLASHLEDPPAATEA